DQPATGSAISRLVCCTAAPREPILLNRAPRPFGKGAPLGFGGGKRPRSGSLLRRVEHCLAPCTEVLLVGLETSNDGVDVRNLRSTQAEPVRRTRRALVFGAEGKADGRVENCGNGDNGPKENTRTRDFFLNLFHNTLHLSVSAETRYELFDPFLSEANSDRSRMPATAAAGGFLPDHRHRPSRRRLLRLLMPCRSFFFALLGDGFGLFGDNAPVAVRDLSGRTNERANSR